MREKGSRLSNVSSSYDPILYYVLGVYCDSKIFLIEPLDLLLSRNKFSLASSQSILVKDLDRAIQNSFMAMPPGTEYARKAIDEIVKNVMARSYEDSSLAITGPKHLMNTFDTLDIKDKSIFHFLSFEGYDIYQYSQLPGKIEQVKKQEKQRIVVFHNGEYRRHSKSTGAGNYGVLFDNCQIYGEKKPSKSCHILKHGLIAPINSVEWEEEYTSKKEEEEKEDDDEDGDNEMNHHHQYKRKW